MKLARAARQPRQRTQLRPSDRWHPVNECGRHVLGPGEIADYGAREIQRNDARTAQQYPHVIAALRQLVQQMLSDEPCCAGQRDEWSARRHSCLLV